MLNRINRCQSVKNDPIRSLLNKNRVKRTTGNNFIKKKPASNQSNRNEKKR